MGEESFARQVLKIAKDQEDWKHLTSKEFKPHSDTTPLGRYRMTIARGFLGADYSLINEDMGVHKGHTRVNELPLFGDVLFLQTLKDNFPSIFAKVVSEWQSDPKISTLISQYFPAAKQLIS